MSSALIPHLANMLLSTRLLNLKRALSERKRKRSKRAHVVTVYLAINDAYSYVLLQVLRDLQDRYPIEFDFRCVLNRQQEMFPAPNLWDNNAFIDGGYLANLYQLNFPNQAPQQSSQLDAQATAQLLHWELQPGFLQNALRLFKAYWQEDSQQLQQIIDPAIGANTECYQHHLLNNEGQLKDNGHYLSAMLHYGGEWYWGLDRLQYLERRLNGLNLNVAPAKIKFDLGQKNFCQQLDVATLSAAQNEQLKGQPIEMFWSIRSPYSYIALVRARQLCEHYGVPLLVKPVLPMVMRRMQVPKNKRGYIAADAKREAVQCGVPFGKIADPLGKGVERCYALFDYAQSQGKGLDYLENYAKGVWSQGIRSDTDNGLQKIVESTGLDWQQAKAHVNNTDWQYWAQENLAQLYGYGLWGVPSFKYGELKLFGQDRIDCLERAMVQQVEQVGSLKQTINE